MSCHAALGVVAGAFLTLRASGATMDGVFQSQCESGNDFGWPRFHSLAELQASPWRSYFLDVYGDLPETYPVCVYDFWILDKAAYVRANISGHPVVNASQELQEGDLYSATNSSLKIYHGSWKPLANNTWVEIQHTAFPTELKGFWVWRTRGSGVWYNIGRTMVFPTPSDPNKIHAEAIAFLTANCSVTPSIRWPLQESDIFGSCAREKGIDSIQFEPQQGQKPLGTFGLPGLTEMVLVNIDGHNSCGVDDASKTPLREGWMAKKHCDCKNAVISDSCGLMPKAPFPLTATPLCKLQDGPFWNRWKPCDPSTCLPTTCGKRSIYMDVSVAMGQRFVAHATTTPANSSYVTV